MKHIKTLVFALAACAALSGWAKAKKGNCAEKPLSLKSSQSVTLVDEWSPGEDDEKGEFLGTGASYYKVKLKKGVAYTIWISGGNAEDIDFDVDIYWPEYDKDKYDKEKNEGKVPGAAFDVEDVDGGAIKVAYLYSDDWDADEDPSSGLYLVTLQGDIGAKTTLYFTSGIRTFTTTGSAEAPKVISMADKWKTFSSKMVEDAYVFRTSLKAGRRYRVRTTGGTASAPLDLDVDDGTDDDGDEGEEFSDVMEDSSYASDTNNTALVVTPSASGKYTITVTGDTSQKFKFYYTAIPKRAIASHPALPLRTEACGDETNGYSVRFVPGRKANTNSYYDDIIDEHLCKIYMAKGERWVFETSGATKEQEMIAYDSKGNTLETNTYLGDGTYDTRVVVTASAAGMYYIGVCDPSLEVDDTPDAGQITLTARNAANLVAPDRFDPEDDVYTGASPLAAYPATTNDVFAADVIASNEVAAAAIGAISGPHRLDANDLYDWFALPCRSGCRYRLRAVFLDEGDTATNITLSAVAYYYVSGVRKAAATTGDTYGDISPKTAANDQNMDFTFTAKANGMHYIRVRVAEGLGLAFPSYAMTAVVDKGEAEFGLLKVGIDGDVGSWYLNSETAATYPGGATLALPAPVSPTVKFAAVGGFAAPAAVSAEVPVWTPGDDPVAARGRYEDAYDAKYIMSYTTKTTTKNGKKTTTKVANYSPADGDATPAGAFAIVPAATSKTAKRTLWADDPADHFSFTAAAGTYYDFTVRSESTNLTLVVSNAVTGATFAGTPLADGTGAELPKLLLEAGKTFVVVSHGDGEGKDASYTLEYAKATPGIVRFTNAKSVATTSFSVKEGTEYATLYVARTGTEGVTRVKYATQAGTALPGTNYYPVTDGEVVWKAGDKAAKAIKIRMVPDLVAHWAASNLVFSVKLFPVDEFDLGSGEYLARTNTPQEATVTITEATAKKIGTISLTAFGEGDEDDERIANVKKPVATGIAGNGNFTLTFSRTGGTDGKVSVKVSTSTAKGDTAKAGVDYVAASEVLTWEDGDDEDKTFEIELPETSGYTASKKFTVTMAVVKTGFTPTLSAKTATVTVKNAVLDQTAAAYAKTIASSTGLKLASTGTWFNDYNGTLRSASAAGTLTYTLTGPGFFVCEPSLVLDEGDEEGSARLTCQFNKETPIDCTDTNAFNGRIARVVGKGTTTVKFALSGVAGGAYAAFEPQEDGAPYLWIPFSKVAPADPMSKAVVLTNKTTLAWTMPDELANEPGICTRVRFGTVSNPQTRIAYDAAAACEAAVPDALVPGKTYYWALDYAYTDATNVTEEVMDGLAWTPGPATWNFSALAENAPVTGIAEGCVDASGESVADRLAKGEPVELLQGVKPDLGLCDDDDESRLAATGFRLVGGALPKGVTINATTGRLAGAPSVPGEYTALLQSFNKTGKTVSKKVNGKTVKTTTYTYAYGSTVAVPFTVLPAGTSIGSFRGAVVEDGETFKDDARAVGDVTLSVTSAGKLTAKVTIAGIAYSFTGTGWDEVLSYDETAEGATRRLAAVLSNTISITTTVSGKKKTTKYTNKMTVEMGDGASTNTVALAEKLGSVRIDGMKVLNAKKTAFTADVSYAGDLYRNNGATAEGKEAMADFAGYYTVALAPEAVTAADGVPAGNGYLLLTVAEANTVKVTGVLADGTSVSYTTVGQLVGDDLADQRTCVLNVPVCVSKAAFGLAGVVQIAVPDGGETALPVALPAAKLSWVKTKATATSRDGAGFTISLAPTGGWYDKIVNLQAYYLGKEFALYGAEAGEDLPAEALASGYAFATESTPQDLAVKFTGNAMSVASRKLVKNNTLGLYDFVDGATTTSVNPWNVAVKFTRATGVVTGTFSAWEWKYRTVDGYTYPTVQKELTKLAHKGVLLFTRDGSSESPLAENALTAGFFLMPATTSTKTAVKNAAWKASLPFNILTVGEPGESWDERDFGTEDPE